MCAKNIQRVFKDDRSNGTEELAEDKGRRNNRQQKTLRERGKVAGKIIGGNLLRSSGGRVRGRKPPVGQLESVTALQELLEQGQLIPYIYFDGMSHCPSARTMLFFMQSSVSLSFLLSLQA